MTPRNVSVKLSSLLAACRPLSRGGAARYVPTAANRGRLEAKRDASDCAKALLRRARPLYLPE